MQKSENPYESPEVEAPAGKSADSVRGGMLWRGSIAVLILAACVGLSALGRLVAGVVGLATLRKTEVAGLGGRPLFPEELTEAQFTWSLERAAFDLISGAVFGVFAWLLLRYARQLRQAAEGTISLDETLKAQIACWYMATALTLLYFARVLGLPIVSLG